MNQDTANLIDSVRDDPEAKPPFFWHHVRPEVQKWGIREIWVRASPVTRPFFDLGATNGEYGPNWVTGWLLYSVFRSRDIRNNRSRRRNMQSGNHAAGGGGGGGGGSDSQAHANNKKLINDDYDENITINDDDNARNARVLQPLVENAAGSSHHPEMSMPSKLDTLSTTMTTSGVITPTTASTEEEENPRASTSKSTTKFYDPVRNGILTYHHS